MNRRNARRTLTRFYLYTALNGLQFGWTTWLAFVLSRGGNPGWAESAFHLAILFGEVPTGIVADLVGRRSSMLIGLAVGAAASFGYLGIHGTLGGVLVLALSGLGSTFLSGADTALLYDAAVAEGGPDLARRALARANALQMGSLALAPIIAGFLYEWQTTAPFIARGIVSLVCLAVVWGMADTARARRRDESVLTTLRGHVRESFALVFSSRGLMVLMLFSWGYNALISMASQYAQAYFPYVGLSMGLTGIVFSLSRVLSAGASALSERMQARWVNLVLRLGPMVQSLGYAGMALTRAIPGAALFTTAEALDGILYPALQARLNESIPAARRATLLSVQSLGTSLLMAAAFPAASYLSPVPRIYLVTGLVGLAMSLWWIAGSRAVNWAAQPGVPGEGAEAPPANADEPATTPAGA
ncbi:MAG: MFS transporter [Bacillota bacterium]